MRVLDLQQHLRHETVPPERGPANEIYEGTLLANKSVIITKFPDAESLHAFWESVEYSAIKPKREGTGIYNIGVYEGAE